MRRLRALFLLLPLAIAPGCVVAASPGYGYSQPYYAPAPRYYAPAPRFVAPRPVYRPYYAPRPHAGYGGGHGRGHWGGDRRHWR